MKKTYINPETILTEMELQQMIAVSGPGKSAEEFDDGLSKDFTLFDTDSFDDIDDEDDTSLPGFNVWED